MTVVTRFPPSPTGFMHIGNARTALYNWLYAKHHGGKMLFRIEDTDRARHSEEAVVQLINDLKWLGLDWDGEIVSQFEQRQRHIEVAEQLLAEGKAYQCYCTPEELSQMRETARKEGWKTAYDRRWRDRDPSEAPAGVQPVIRIKAPLTGQATVPDQVQGDVTVAHDQLDDFILLRSDGTPTYMLSVVVDDHDMGVTHVIRGDDHLNNTFRQNIIYEAMGWDKPTYAHLPLILGPDGAKFSKRHGAASVGEYKNMGYLPEALRNYLLRLGWSHGDEEIISTPQAVEWFDLDAVGKSAARFDFAKLESLNAHYIKECGNNRLADSVKPILEEIIGADIKEDIWEARMVPAMAMLKSRAKTLHQIAEEGAFFVKALPYDFTEKAEKILKEDPEMIALLYERLSGLKPFDSGAIELACREIAEAHRNGKLGKVAMPFRAAITGTTVSPSVFEAAALLGQEEISARLAYARESFG